MATRLRALAFTLALLWVCTSSASAQTAGTFNQDEPTTGAATSGDARSGAVAAVGPASPAQPPVSQDSQGKNAAPAAGGEEAQPAATAKQPDRVGDESPGTAPEPSPTTPAPSTPSGEPAAGRSLEDQASDLLKKLTARQFDGRLPETPLPDWLAQQIGKRAQVQWTTADCGDEGGETDAGQGDASAGNSSAGNTDVALCSEAQALFFDASGKPSLDRYVVLQLRVGNRRLGVTDDPSGYGPDALTIFVFDGNSNRTLSRLGDLPGVLATIN
jgi:hypothetical protein